MDLAFPCAGNLDDGIFDLGLEDGRDEVGGGWNRSGPSEPSPSHSNSQVVLSPDALDLALMTFTLPTEEDGSGVKNSAINDFHCRSPLCGTEIRQFVDQSIQPLRGAAMSSKLCFPDKDAIIPPSINQMFQIGEVLTQKCFSSSSNDSESGCCTAGIINCEGTCSSPSHKERRLWAKEKRGSLYDAFPPKFSGDSDGPPVVRPLTSDTCFIPEHRNGEVLHRPARQPLDRALFDVNAQTRWAGERAGTREAVTSILRKEEEALIKIDRATIALGHAASSNVVSLDSTRKKVSFAQDEARRSASSSPVAGHTDEEGWEKNTDEGAAGKEDQDEDLLARSSELHSSVAGQLRSVDELLKRKSYFYVDTSWSARQLPCPPTAWRGKYISGPASGGDGAGMSIEANHGAGSGAARHRKPTLSKGNAAVKLEGRWVATGSKTPKVGVYSIPGEKTYDPTWRSQDACLALAPLDRMKSQALFAVFDGHGINGRQASWECMKRLPKYLVSASRSGDPASALRRTCHRLHRDLATGVAGDCTRSGTTLCAVVLTGGRLTIANVGDSGCIRLSRAVKNSPEDARTISDVSEYDCAVGNRRRRKNTDVDTGDCRTERGRLIVERLSHDHKPDCKNELERIQAAGGVVFPLPITGGEDDSGGGDSGIITPGLTCGGQGKSREERTNVRGFGMGVPRVWKASGDGPGLAMSRSIGDKMAHSVGVTHEPDITGLDLDSQNDVMLVIASDGVWDVLSMEDIRKAAEIHVVDETWCPRALSEEICRKSLSEWSSRMSGGSDDITCLVVKTSGIVPVRRKPFPVGTKTEKALVTGIKSANHRTPPSIFAQVAKHKNRGL